MNTTLLMKPNTTSPILFRTVVRDMAWLRRDGGVEQAPKHKAIIRVSDDKSDGKMIAAVSNTYALVPNFDLFNNIEQQMLDTYGEDARDVFIRDSASRHGATCYREYVFNSIRTAVGAKSDIALRVVVQNSYGGGAIKLLCGAIEFYCSNGMVIGAHDREYRRHTSGVRIDGLGNLLVESTKKFTDFGERIKKWHGIPITHSVAMDLFRAITTTVPQTNRLLERYIDVEEADRGANLYSAYSAVTWIASHNEGAAAVRQRVDSDSVADVLAKRELVAARFINTEKFKQLELA